MNVRFGTIAIVGFILPWVLYVLAWPQRASDVLLGTLLPWVFPLFATASVLWSIDQDQTTRNGIELLLTTAVAVLMARSIPADRLLAAWLLAIVPAVVIGGLLGSTQQTETGEIAATGIFGSKNNFALHVCLLMFLATAVIANPRQGRALRVFALLGLLAAPTLLLRAKSVGALVVFFPPLLLMMAVVILGRMTRRLRQLALIGSLVLLVVAACVITPVALSSQDMFLSMVGKSGDLTGRGYLWYRAGFLIGERPVLGVGYSAFWVQGNLEAEGLWRSEHIASRGGFHFHNFYYETLVELGYVGMFVAGAVLILTSMAVLLWALREPGPESGFFCAIVLFFFMRSFVELDLDGVFSLNALLVPSAWLYATAAITRAGRGAYSARAAPA